MMAHLDILESLLSEVVRPVGNAVANCINHPIDTATSVATGAIGFAQQHPYVTGVIGIGAYVAFKKGWISVNQNRLNVNVNIDTPIFAYKTNTTFRLGTR